MKQDQSGMETDDEDSAPENHFKSQFAIRNSNLFQTSSAMPSVKERQKIRPRSKRCLSMGSTSGFSSSSGSIETDVSVTNTDIFYIYNPIKSIDGTQKFNETQPSNRDRYKKSRLRPKAKLNLEQFEITESNLEQRMSTSTSASVYSSPQGYIKHSNLDVHALSLAEQLRLARIHFFTVPNGIRIALVLFCLGWFIFNAVTIFQEYLTFETLVYMEYRPPKYTLPPAISICTHIL